MTFGGDFNEMLEEDEGGIGQWVVVRHFTQVHSQFWNEETQEAVGGPPFEFIDTVVLAAKQTAFSPARPDSRTGLNRLEHAKTILTDFRYFLRADVTIKEDDEIFDLEYLGREKPTVDYEGTGTGAKITARFKVKFFHSFVQGNRGEIGYNLVIADRSFIT